MPVVYKSESSPPSQDFQRCLDPATGPVAFANPAVFGAARPYRSIQLGSWLSRFVVVVVVLKCLKCSFRRPWVFGVAVLAQKGLQLSQNGLPDRSLSVGTDQVSHLVTKGWIEEWNCRIVAHGGILLN